MRKLQFLTMAMLLSLSVGQYAQASQQKLQDAIAMHSSVVVPTITAQMSYQDQIENKQIADDLATLQKTDPTASILNLYYSYVIGSTKVDFASTSLKAKLKEMPIVQSDLNKQSSDIFKKYIPEWKEVILNNMLKNGMDARGALNSIIGVAMNTSPKSYISSADYDAVYNNQNYIAEEKRINNDMICLSEKFFKIDKNKMIWESIPAKILVDLWVSTYYPRFVDIMNAMK